MKIQRISEPHRKSEVCENVLRKLPLWFGIEPIEEFKTLWGEDNPCWLMIKAL